MRLDKIMLSKYQQREWMVEMAGEVLCDKMMPIKIKDKFYRITIKIGNLLL